jgi:tetratricopeptide (TPR) repeat protein
MNFTDPTYLRTIHVGLMLGAVHKDNVSSIPIGLVGIYEDALPLAGNVNERKKFLDFFLVWALLKTEVSLGFVVSLLEGWTEDEVTYYIAQNSKWFNSLVSGKYSLYHERLRAFVLQKVTIHHLTKQNEVIIEQCRLALQTKTGDEWERYALEHFSTHLLVTAMERNDGCAIKKLAYDTIHWNRQVEVSNGFEWSKRMLNGMMLWASKNDMDEVIECALNIVDLHYLEENDAPRIVELVSQNDIETALQRIDAFGGNDKEGLQRKFILYILCLMELTLLDSKDKAFRREAIEKLLNRLDVNLPVNHSVLNWSYFISSYLIFFLATEWAKLGLDITVIYKRSSRFDGFINKLKYPISDIEIFVFDKMFEFTLDIRQKCVSIIDLVSHLISHDNLQIAESYLFDSINHTAGISDDLTKGKVLTAISGKFFDLKNLKESQFILLNALECTKRGDDSLEKCRALNQISREWINHGAPEKAVSTIDASLSSARNIKDDGNKCIAIKDISNVLMALGKTDQSALILTEAFSITESINTSYIKGEIQVQLATELAINANFDAALKYARRISIDSYLGSDFHQVIALKRVSSELKAIGKFEEALSVILESFECALAIEEPFLKCSALIKVSSEFFELGKLEEAIRATEEAVSSVKQIFNDELKNEALKMITIEIIKQGKLEQAIEFEKLISIGSAKSSVIKNILEVNSLQGNLKDVTSVLRNSLEKFRGPIDDDKKNRLLVLISSELAKKGRIEESLNIARCMNDIHYKKTSLQKICIELFNSGNLDRARVVTQETLECARSITNFGLKSVALFDISCELEKRENADWAATVMQEALECVQNINDDVVKSLALRDISVELSKNGKFEEAHNCTKEINIDFYRALALIEIATVLTNHKKFFDADSLLLEGIECTHKVSIESDKSFIIKEIARLLVINGRLSEALNWIKEIANDSEVSLALRILSVELAIQSKFGEAMSILQTIRCERNKSLAQWGLAIEYLKKNDWKTAENLCESILSDDLRLKCWMNMAETSLGNLRNLDALNKVKIFKKTEARLFYLKGWAGNLSVIDANTESLSKSLPLLINDKECMEELLLKFALQLLFIEEKSPSVKSRLNRSLNFQWAKDINC